jgi:hypothetical protein
VGAVAEILAVELAEPVPGVVRGCYLDAPSVKSRAEAHALDVMGWAVGDQAPVEAVEFLDGDTVVWRVPVDVPRPDLTTAFPELEWAGRAGFAAALTVTGTTPELALQLRAVMPDRTRPELALIRVRRGWRHGAPARAALVSVVIPCYNQAHFMPDPIESVLAQTHPHHEIVVVDDGSTDNTQEVVGRYPGVRCIRQRNCGLAAARNTGIRRSNGDYLVFLDADDRLLPDALQVGLDDMRAHPECAFVSGRYRHIGIDGTPLPTPELPCVGDDGRRSLRGAASDQLHTHARHGALSTRGVRACDRLRRVCTRLRGLRPESTNHPPVSGPLPRACHRPVPAARIKHDPQSADDARLHHDRSATPATARAR